MATPVQQQLTGLKSTAFTSEAPSELVIHKKTSQFCSYQQQEGSFILIYLQTRQKTSRDTQLVGKMTILSVTGESQAAWTSLLYRQPSAPPAAPAGAQAAEQKLVANQLPSHETCPKVSGSSPSLSTDLRAPELSTPPLLRTQTHILPHKAQEHEENEADQPPRCRKRLGHG